MSSLGLFVGLAPGVGGLPPPDLTAEALAVINAKNGSLWIPAKAGSVFQDRTQTPSSPAAAGEPVGAVLDLSSAGRALLAPSDAARPVLRQAAGRTWLEFDGVDDFLATPSGLPGMTDALLGVALQVPEAEDNLAVFWGDTGSTAHYTMLTQAGSGAAPSTTGGAVSVDGAPAASRDALKTALDGEGWHVADDVGADLSGWVALGVGGRPGFSNAAQANLAALVACPSPTTEEITLLRELLAAQTGGA